MKAARWIDRHLEITPVFLFLVSFAVIVALFHRKEVSLLRDLPADIREQVYSTFAGVSGSLLGFSLATVSILVSLGQGANPVLRAARIKVVGTLFCSGFFFLVDLALAVIGLALDRSGTQTLVQELLAASVCASTLGLVVGGGAFYLTVLASERDSS